MTVVAAGPTHVALDGQRSLSLGSERVGVDSIRYRGLVWAPFFGHGNLLISGFYW